MTRRTLPLLLLAIAIAAAACHSHHGGGLAPNTPPPPTPTPGASVLTHHHSGNRRGVYVVPGLTEAVAATLRLDTSFAPAVSGSPYAQLLYWDGPELGGESRLFAVTEDDQVSAFDASSGAVVWQKSVGTSIPLGDLPCGNIDPLGITGTPVIDAQKKLIAFDAMTDAGGGTPKQKIFALSVDDGSSPGGYPLDLDTIAHVPGASFDSTVQNQRAAVALVKGTAYFGYGGHSGDCGNYYGWVVGVPLADPAAARSWIPTPVTENGVAIWSPGGIADDGVNLYVATGNTVGGGLTSYWSGSEALIRLNEGPVFSGSTNDFFAPSNWPQLDQQDLDLAGTEPLLVDDSASRPSRLVVGLGKDGNVYLVDRDAMGGVGGELFTTNVASNEIINASASYRTAQGLYVVFKGDCVLGGSSGDVSAVKIDSGSPPQAHVAWCASMNGGLGSPMVTQTQVDGGDTIVWVVSADIPNGGDGHLYGFDGDTGAVVYGGGGPGDGMGNVPRYVTPIVARGRITLAGDGRLYRFVGP